MGKWAVVKRDPSLCFHINLYTKTPLHRQLKVDGHTLRFYAWAIRSVRSEQEVLCYIDRVTVSSKQELGHVQVIHKLNHLRLNNDLTKLNQLSIKVVL